VNVNTVFTEHTKMVRINSVEFSDWITRKFVEWRGDRYGKSASVKEFARLFGASQQLMSDWMRADGKVPRDAKYISALVAFYGAEAYEVLGLPLPDVPVGMEEIEVDQLPPDLRDQLEAAVSRLTEMLESGVDVETDEGLKQVLDTLREFGFTIKAIK
jgi:hypothetical protein